MDDYKTIVANLIPGDRLQFAAGTYTDGLDLRNKNGQPGKCIVIEGPVSGPPALFEGSDQNLVRFENSSYIAVRNLVLDGLGRGGDGIKAEATGVSVHHILLERLTLRNFNQYQQMPNQQIVGINTKCPAWNWVIRYTTITSTGTGMYFGNSDGQDEFVNSLIEYNLIYDTLGYNAQFKHQIGRDTSIGVPATGTTIIRHNVFSKETGSSSGELARPNLLVGHWPPGTGSSDIYQIYGNFFYQNPTPEPLFQGEGNIAFHDNLMVDSTGDAVRIQWQNGAPKRIEVFNNTIVAAGHGIRIVDAASGYPQRVVGNAVFAGTPLTGGQQSNNVPATDPLVSNYYQASTYLNNPTLAPGSGLDLYPKTGQLQGAAIDYSPFSGLLEWDRDFNGGSRVTTYRGAYSGAGPNPGWMPALAIKQAPPAGGGGSVLQNGVPVSGISGAFNSEQFWTMTVPAGASNLQFQMSGGSGDADLYVRFGSAPTRTTWDCRPYASGNNETCSFAWPAAGTWHVMIVGDDPYSGVTLTGSYQTSPTVLQNGVPVSGISGTQGSQKGWTMTVPTGASNLQFQTSGGTGDVDLYVRSGTPPTMTTWTCRPFASNNNETCTFAAPAAGTWYLMLIGDDPYSGVTLLGSYQTGPTCNSISDVEPNGSGTPQVISGPCNQIAGTFVNESSADDYFRLSLPAGRTVTALLNGLTADYDVFLYNAAGTELARSVNGGTTPDQASWTNTGSSAVNVNIRVNRYVTTQATYQLKVTY